jgi:hypothetical protein
MYIWTGYVFHGNSKNSSWWQRAKIPAFEPSSASNFLNWTVEREWPVSHINGTSLMGTNGTKNCLFISCRVLINFWLEHQSDSNSHFYILKAHSVCAKLILIFFAEKSASVDMID